MSQPANDPHSERSPSDAARLGARQEPQTIRHWRILKISLPVIVSNASVPLVGAVDTAVLGRLPDPAYLAGAALGATALSLTVFNFSFLRIVTGGFAAQAFGANDRPELLAVFWRALFMALIIGLVLVLLSPALLVAARWFFIDSATTEDYMARYLSIRLLSAPFILGNMVVLALLIGQQRTGLMVALQFLLNGLNIGLDLVFVIGWDWRIEGVAWASVIAEASAFVMGGALVLWPFRDLAAPWARLFNAQKLKQLLSANTDILIRNLAMQAVFSLMLRYASNFGTVMVAATAIHMHFLEIAAYGLDGFAVSVESLCGAAFGQKNRPLFRDIIKKTSIWAFALALVISIAYALASGQIIALMTTIDAVRQAAELTALYAAVLPLIGVWAYQADGVFFGTTQSAGLRNSTLVGALAFWVLVLFTQRLGIISVWLGLAAFFAARALVLILSYPRIEALMAAQPEQGGPTKR